MRWARDFQYSTALDSYIYPSGGAGPSSRPYTPVPGSTAAADPFSPLPAFSSVPYSAGMASPHNSFTMLPPEPPAEPAPLFDSTESALFSSFLNTLDVDPNFLFNPVLPPGMPSPPSSSFLHGGGSSETERDSLGRGVGGMDLGARGRLSRGGSRMPSGSTGTSTARSTPRPAASSSSLAAGPPPPPLSLRQASDDERDADGDWDDGEEVEMASAKGDEDHDFVPNAKAPPRGTRRKSRAGGASGSTAEPGRSGKKPRTSRTTVAPTPYAYEGMGDGEDTTMSYAEEASGATAAPEVSASGRPKRSTRVPRHLAEDDTPAASPPAAPSRRGASARPPLHKIAPAPPAVSPVATSPAASTSAARQASTSPKLIPRGDSGSPPPSSLGGANKPVPLTESQKRSNHILSEQKRRNAIRSGFKDLVDLLAAGEAASGIVLGGGAGGGAAGGDAADDDAGPSGKKRKGGKGGAATTASSAPAGRGRGRKGDVAANASKSVVLAQAANYILWLERGNRALETEVSRVEGLLRDARVAE
ncbi:hypothetical protein Rhopal_002653-T1 [Rhodotorula paludigena]|uniref:BHLH domain-containing protein n=1 Tax=Rhodotorula paludigena TaxID=86838 RepID=A0AAV5GJJ1_9BASI|nr:hypothetical protein Rhopal_002653-T1 [Rhodotorula paludigena]